MADIQWLKAQRRSDQGSGVRIYLTAFDIIRAFAPGQIPERMEYHIKRYGPRKLLVELRGEEE